MHEPKNLNDGKSYLGLLQYYGKCIPRLPMLAALLNSLRKGVLSRRDEEQRETSNAVKGKLSAAESLVQYNPDSPVALAMDASEYRLGAVLYHQYENGAEKVIACASRSLTKEGRNYAQI